MCFAPTLAVVTYQLGTDNEHAGIGPDGIDDQSNITYAVHQHAQLIEVLTDSWLYFAIFTITEWRRREKCLLALTCCVVNPSYSVD